MRNRNFLKKWFTIVTIGFLFAGCAQFDSPVEIPEAGTIEVITTSDAKCQLFQGEYLLMEWTGSKTINGLLPRNYRVKISSEKFSKSFEESIILGPYDRKKVDTGIGSLDIRIRSDFAWELSFSGKLVSSGKGSYRIDTLWAGTYGVKVTVPGVTNSFQRNIDIAKSQTFNLEMEYGSIDVRVPGSMECVLLSGNTEIQRWNGSRVIDSLWTANYTVKVKANPLLPEYESSFTLAKQQVKVVELEYGSLEVKVPSQVECVLIRGTSELERWFGSKTYDSLWVGDYKVKVKVNPLLPDYETSFTLAKQQVKVVELEYGSLEVKVPSQMECVLLRGTTELERWTGTRVLDSLWVGDYTVKVKVNPLLPDYESNFSLAKQQVKVVELDYGSLDVKVPSQMECVLMRGTSELARWFGGKTFDSLWVGDYTVKVKVNPLLPEYESSFTLAKQQVKVVELEYGSLEVKVPSQMECVLIRGTSELERWFGSKTYDSLWVGDYTIRVKVNPLLPDYESNFSLAKQQIKVVELQYGKLDVRVPGGLECVLLRGTTEMERWTGGKVIDSLWVGDYTVKIKVNPALPDYETSFTLGSQQVKVVEPGIGSFVIKTRSDYQNTLFRDGIQIVSWSGSKEFLPYLTGNYSLKSKMFPSASPVEQNFTITPNENRTIEWDYGKIVITGEGATCKLKRDGVEVLDWSGNRTLDSVITGSYSVEIQESNSPNWSENFLLSKDQTKNIAIPYGSITVTSNAPSTITKLIYNDTVSKTLTGNGTISNIVPGDYTLTYGASGYIGQTEAITVANGQNMQKTIVLIRSMEMIYIPAGTFTMGCTSEQNNCWSPEFPTHQVSLSAYEIGKYEVTQSQWRTVMGTNPSNFTGDNRPVENVSWYDVINFCNALSIREGLTPVYTVNGTNVTTNWSANGYRLPTEAEWEYAARGGGSSTNTQYSGSNTPGDVAWYSSNSNSTTHDVGTKSPNQLGIYDMSGNVWEWCWDWYSDNYYSTSPSSNPKGPSSGSSRVLRGGSWNVVSADYCRVAYRRGSDPDNRNRSNGFRSARTR